MKTLILYCSKSLGNTKKVVDAFVQAHLGDVDAIDATALAADGTDDPDLSDYDLVGFVSGIYNKAFDESVISAASRCLRGDEFVFICSTASSNKHDAAWNAIRDLCQERGALVLGSFGCTGVDSRGGSHRLTRVFSQSHPNERDIRSAVSFFDTMLDHVQELTEEDSEEAEE